jgi:hypothetical protein
MSAGPANVNPADYDLPSLSHWDPPDWLLKFARDQVWPFVDSRPKAELIAALNRWLGCHAEKDEFLRQLALLDKERRRLACLGGLEECERLLAAQIDDRIAHVTGAYNEPPLDLPFPPPRQRTPSRDASLVALMALNDETRDHSQRIGPTNSSLYAIVCAEVRKLKRKHLAGLQPMIKTVQQSPPPADETQKRGPVETPAAGSTATSIEDDSAYRPASEFLAPERFPTLKAIGKALAANPWIRSRRPTGKNGKPISNRLNIHAGDWHKFVNQSQGDPLDQPASVVDAVLETEKRKAAIRNKAGK